MTVNFIFMPAQNSNQSCPNCGSANDIIPWGKGWMCRDCGYEWDTPQAER